MNEKYKTLNELENIIAPYILRNMKEVDKPSSYMKFNILNEVREYLQTFFSTKDNKEKIIIDIINFICDSGNITVEDLMKDINRSCNEYITTPNKLINFISNRILPLDLVTKPLFNMMPWSFTSKGEKFYRKLDEKMRLELRISKLIIYYDLNIF